MIKPKGLYDYYFDKTNKGERILLQDTERNIVFKVIIKLFLMQNGRVSTDQHGDSLLSPDAPFWYFAGFVDEATGTMFYVAVPAAPDPTTSGSLLSGNHLNVERGGTYELGVSNWYLRLGDLKLYILESAKKIE